MNGALGQMGLGGGGERGGREGELMRSGRGSEDVGGGGGGVRMGRG